MKGWLHVEVRAGLSWQRVFATTKDGDLLLFEEEPNEFSSTGAIASLPLSGSAVSPPKNKRKRPFCFRLDTVCEGRNKLVFSASTEKELLEWTQHLKEKAGKCLARRFAESRKRSSVSVLSASSIASSSVPVKAGWLRKKGVNLVNRWKKRWFVLHFEMLSYFENPSRLFPIFSIPLSQNVRVLLDDEDGDPPFRFSLHFYDSDGESAAAEEVRSRGRQRYELSADDDEARRSWVGALLQATQVGEAEEETEKRSSSPKAERLCPPGLADARSSGGEEADPKESKTTGKLSRRLTVARQQIDYVHHETAATSRREERREDAAITRAEELLKKEDGMKRIKRAIESFVRSFPEVEATVRPEQSASVSPVDSPTECGPAQQRHQSAGRSPKEARAERKGSRFLGRLSSHSLLSRRWGRSPSTELALSLPQACSMYHSFMERLDGDVLALPCLAREQDDIVDAALLLVQDYTMAPLHERMMKACEKTEEDTRFFHRLQAFQFLTAKHLEIEMDEAGPLEEDKDIRRAIGEIMSLSERKTPFDKMVSFFSTATAIQDYLQLRGKDVTADALFPRIVFCIIRANLPGLKTHLRFVEHFKRPMIEGDSGLLQYFLTHFNAAVVFLENLSAGQLVIDKEEFESEFARLRVENAIGELQQTDGLDSEDSEEEEEQFDDVSEVQYRRRPAVSFAGQLPD